MSETGSMPGIRAISSALAVVACAIGVAACGGEDDAGPIPRDEGDQLLAQLDQIESAVERQDCDEAQATALAFADRVDSLPSEVGGELREALVRASVNLESLSSTQCEEPEIGPSGETGVTPPPTTDTTTTSTTDTTTTTDDEPPPDDTPGGGPPDDTPGNGNPGGGDGDDDDSSGGIGSGD